MSMMPYRAPMPASDTLLWRFMDFTKFVAMLEGRSLWFTRADKFEDKWEMSYPTKLAEAVLASIQNLNTAGTSKISVGSTHASTFINCWHANLYESAAMWKLYASNNEGIAIVSRLGSLNEAMNPNFHLAVQQPKMPPVPVEEQLKQQMQDIAEVKSGTGEVYQCLQGMVTYLDFTQDMPSIDPRLSSVNMAYFKRKSFDHEREFRIILEPMSRDSARLPEAGLSIPVDTSKLIETIYVSPTAAPWLTSLVTSLKARYGLPDSINIIHSSLYDIA